MERAFSGLSPSLRFRDVGALSVAAAAGLVVYLIASQWTHSLGFPLDDSWIHATFARNLALRGQWAMQLGQPSAASTSPLWTALLAPGYWVGLAPLWWSHLLNLAMLVGLGLMTEAGVRHLEAGYRPPLPLVGLLVVTEWHLLWAAASGMETILQAFLSTGVLLLLVHGSKQYTALGLLCGLSIWVRPDGLLLSGVVVLALAGSSAGKSVQIRALSSYVLGLGALLLPYVAVHLGLSGAPMPNAFYAKQAEYAAWQARPVAERFATGVLQLSAGPAVLLWPGLGLAAVQIARKGDFRLTMALLWCILYPAIYLLRLPAYQHGRYLMPAMPMLLLLAVLGALRLGASSALGKYRWTLQKSWQVSVACLSLAFLGLGARAYGQDVALIETEMVATASWASKNLPAAAVIAAHDIGALGYYDDHSLRDLAGLASPEVVPFMRDEAGLAAYLDQQGVKYLIAFPGQYPMLTSSSTSVHASGGRFASAAGQGNLTVYCWRCP